jgi:hypothetical protein
VSAHSSCPFGEMAVPGLNAQGGPFGLCGRPSSLAAISVARSPHPKIPFLADKALRLAPLRALSPVGLFVTIMSSSSDEALRKPLTAPTGVEVRDGAP